MDTKKELEKEFFDLEKKYQKEKILKDTLFLDFYNKLLKFEGVNSILELDKKIFPKLKNLKMIISKIEESEKKIILQENYIKKEIKNKKKLSMASTAYKNYKKK